MDDRTLARFMSKVEVQPNGCWRWLGKLNRQGYGYFWLDGKSRFAHRVSFEHFHGPIPGGYEIDHLCHTRDISCAGGVSDPHRACVFPGDLEAVPGLENIMRSRGVAAENAAKTHCKHGHEFTAENTYVYPSGDRGCRICHSAAVKEWARVNRPASGHRPEDKTHCPQGHPYDEVNTFVNVRGARVCLTCRREKDREAKRNLRAAAKKSAAG
jgi:hypothetical protein